MLAAGSEDHTNRSPLATCITELPQTGSTLLWHVPNHLSEEKIATTPLISFSSYTHPALQGNQWM